MKSQSFLVVCQVKIRVSELRVDGAEHATIIRAELNRSLKFSRSELFDLSENKLWLYEISDEIA